jgi:hypothetical protein
MQILIILQATSQMANLGRIELCSQNGVSRRPPVGLRTLPALILIIIIDTFFVI